jgi:hypothetical protein
VAYILNMQFMHTHVLVWLELLMPIYWGCVLSSSSGVEHYHKGGGSGFHPSPLLDWMVLVTECCLVEHTLVLD